MLLTLCILWALIKSAFVYLRLCDGRYGAVCDLKAGVMLTLIYRFICDKIFIHIFLNLTREVFL